MSDPVPDRPKRIGEVIQYYSLPIVYGTHWKTEGPVTVNNGTGSLLQLDGRKLIVTARHVVEGFRERLQEDADTAMQVGEGRLRLKHLVSESKDFDIAVFDAGALEENGAEWRLNRIFYQPPCWPPREVSPDDTLGFSGYAGCWTDVGPGELAMHSFNAVSTGVNSVFDSHLSTQVQLESSGQWLRDQSKPFGGLGGLSGCPVFAWRPLFPELVGFVVEGGPLLEDGTFWDAVTVRRALVLDDQGLVRDDIWSS